MQFRKTAISASILASLLLAGCGGSSDNPEQPPVDVQTQGQFIDAAVEGLYYVAQPSGKNGYTDRDGKYDFEANDTITFFLGGESGLRIGKTSARRIISPFEATGNYQKAVNLARILQTMGDTTSTHITLPQSVIAPDAGMILALNNVSLHDMDSANDLLDELNDSEWISEEDALEHLNNSLEGLERGSNEILTDWQRGSGKYLRSISSSLSARSSAQSNEVYNVHADKLLDEELFDSTRGKSTQTFQLDENQLTILAGSNDTTLTGSLAAQFLTCLDRGDNAEVVKNGDGSSHIECDSAEMDDNDIDTAFKLGSSFSYALLNPQAKLDADESETWDEVRSFGPLYSCMADKNCSENALTGFAITEYDDSDEQDDSAWREDVLNTTYDSVSGVFTEVRKRTHTSGVYNGRISQSLGFAYLVDSPTSERYVDFKGTWNVVMTRPNCDLVAHSTNTFHSSGATFSGQEFQNGCNLVDFEATATYEELADMDFWWFNTNGAGNNSKATLTQLNSTIRWCDIDEDDDIVDNGNCNDGDNSKINRWEYAPAGAEWDQGILNRRTLNSDGSIGTTISMYKI
ncbi:hypothetical protein [uncultured Vibrio sp.]|uniref:hypothetical protein n=1 Tax=uncultured Vibrio sp. TaxID=114054 RepID=UPI0025FA3273|nr:hypothetical protein [uncultured Vibrio sp.]